MTSHLFLILLGGLLVLAFLAEAAFSRTRIPPVLILIGSGVVLGPITGLLPAEDFIRVAPHFGAFAFLLILFEGGLELDLKSVLRGAAPGLTLALSGFLAAFLAVGGVAKLSGASWISAVALGIALAPISGAIVLPLASRLGLRSPLRTLIVIEAASADVLAVLAMGLLRKTLHEGDVAGLVAVGSIMAAIFSVLLAVVAGLVWPRILRALGARRYLDALTFGLALLGWGIVELIGASGALAILVFGLTLANERPLLELLRIEPGEVAELAEETTHRLEDFIGQLTFLVRAFFFVFLGVVVQFRTLTLLEFLQAAAILSLFLLTRFLILWFFERGKMLTTDRAERVTLLLLQPRGLVSAVLAIEATRLGLRSTEAFLGIASLIIIGSNALVPLGMQKAKRAPHPERGLASEGVPEPALAGTPAASEALGGTPRDP